jgi:diguanylate cyclase (GGDEF)-like protein
VSQQREIGTARATDLLAAWAVHFAGTAARGFDRAAQAAAADLGTSLGVDHLSLSLSLPSRDRREVVAWSTAGEIGDVQRRALVDLAGDEPLVVPDRDAHDVPPALRAALLDADLGAVVLVPLGAPKDDPGNGPELTPGSHLLAGRRSGSPWSPDQTAVLRGAGRVAAATYLVARGVAGAEHHPAVAEALRSIGHRDPVTGLGNRTGLREHLDRIIAEGPGPVAVAFVDLERFKRINDTLGHLLGDLLLERVAEQLTAAIRSAGAPEGTTAFRFNSADFVVVIPGGGEEAAEDLLGVIAAAMVEPVDVNGHRVSLQSRGGIAVGPRDGATADQLIGAADLAMLAAKARGTTRETFTPELAERARMRLAIEERLPRALEDGGLNVVYQPLLRLADRSLFGVETLARWKDRELGTVSPGEFVPIASATGSIVALGRVVLDLTLRQAREWRRAGSVAPAAVNVSAEELRTEDYADVVLNALRAHGLPAGALEVEISEATMIDHDEAAIHTLRRLEAAGVRLALDDFGARFSSLAHLRNVRLHHIKLDRDLVERVDSSTTDRAIVKAVVDVARALQADVTGEGIEREATIDALLELGVDVGQGHALARPGSPDQVMDLLVRPAAD